MDIKKDDILFGSPEYTDGRPLEDHKLSFWKHLNILGICRILFGYVRNSSGQRDNMLMCVYISIAIFGAGIWWATHQEVKHTINIPGVKTKLTKKNSIIRKSKKTETVPKTNKATKTTVQINASPPPPLPSAYYYVLFGLVLLFVLAYYARREAGRNFIWKMTQAVTGHNTEGTTTDLSSTVMGYVNQAVSKISGTTTTPTITTPTATTTTTSTETTTITDDSRH